MKITFLSHACFLLEDGRNSLLIDPYLTGNPLAPAKAEELSADFIAVTHAHGDHLGDTAAIAKRCGSTVFAVAELARMLRNEGLTVSDGNLGGSQATAFGRIKYLPACHGSGIPGGLACGLLVEMGGKKIYHAGDTALISDMALLKEEEIDVALLPIGDYYTMGPRDAVRAADLIRPKLTVPMHYNTFPAVRQDPLAFQAMMEAKGLAAKVMAPGEILNL